MPYGAKMCVANGVRYCTNQCSDEASAVKVEQRPRQEKSDSGSHAGQECNDYSAAYSSDRSAGTYAQMIPAQR